MLPRTKLMDVPCRKCGAGVNEQCKRSIGAHKERYDDRTEARRMESSETIACTWVVIVQHRDTKAWKALGELQPTQHAADRASVVYMRANPDYRAARWHDMRDLIENMFKD